jgi:hypothetical protein
MLTNPMTIFTIACHDGSEAKVQDGIMAITPMITSKIPTTSKVVFDIILLTYLT